MFCPRRVCVPCTMEAFIVVASVRHTGDGLGRLMLPDIHLKPIYPVTLFIELMPRLARGCTDDASR